MSPEASVSALASRRGRSRLVLLEEFSVGHCATSIPDLAGRIGGGELGGERFGDAGLGPASGTTS